MTIRFLVALSCFNLVSTFASRAEDSSGGGDLEKPRERSANRVEYLTEKKGDNASKTDYLDRVDVRERPLQQIVEYLSTASGVTIRLKPESLKKLPITISWREVTWRQALDLVCKQQKLRIDETQLNEKKLIVVYKPETITLTYRDADIRDVIFTIANTGNLNVVIDPEVQGKVTATLKDVAAPEALEVIAKSLGYIVVQERGSFQVKGQ